MAAITLDEATRSVLDAHAEADGLTVAEAAARAIMRVAWGPRLPLGRRERAIDAYVALISQARQTGVVRRATGREPDDRDVAAIDLDEETFAMVRFAAEVSGLTPAEVVARAVRRYSEVRGEESADPWHPVDVHAEYEGHRVEGKYLPATRRLTVVTPPLAGAAFRSPSAAARAVVTAFKPSRANSPTNGWKFWRISETNERLDALRGE